MAFKDVVLGTATKQSFTVANSGDGMLVELKTPHAALRPRPESDRLEANYPNPFNPRMAIEYQLSTAGAVSLEIYDILGQQIRTLVDELQPEGS